MVDDSNPSVYLVGEPSREGHILTEQAGAHDGAPVPFWMFAEVALRLFGATSWIGRMDGAWKRVRRYVYLAAGFAAANIGIVGANLVHAHDGRVAAEERAAAGERAFDEYRRVTDDKIEQLRLDVRELRAMLRRIGGGGPDVPTSDIWTAPDKLSLIDKGRGQCLRLAPVTLSDPSL